MHNRLLGGEKIRINALFAIRFHTLCCFHVYFLLCFRVLSEYPRFAFILQLFFLSNTYKEQHVLALTQYVCVRLSAYNVLRLLRNLFHFTVGLNIKLNVLGMCTLLHIYIHCTQYYIYLTGFLYAQQMVD